MNGFGMSRSVRELDGQGKGNPMISSMSRRKFVGIAASSAVAASPVRQSVAATEAHPTTGLGLVIYVCNIRRRWMQRRYPDFNLFEPLTFLKHCHSLGAGGMQANLGGMASDEIARLSEFAKEKQLFIDAVVKPPRDKSDLGRFEKQIVTARDVGVQAARTVIMPGRRYERFKSLAEFREFESRGRTMLELAVPVVEKHRVPLAVENHKDQRLDERIALFQHLESEFVGACVDTGNSFALLDDPYETIEALAPFAFTVHLKDQALQRSEDGFWLGDTALGQGSFDLRRMVAILRKAKPQIRFALELITRDALKVPCLTDAYWETMPNVPARDLARSLRFVREHPAKLQSISDQSLEKQLEIEDSNVLKSLQFAREELKL